MTIPLILIHTGFDDYLYYGIKHNKKFADNIILIGDNDNSIIKKHCSHYNYKDYFNYANEFIEIYQHFSTNHYWYELFCFTRWFVLYEFVTKHKIDKFFLIDSDVLLFENIQNIEQTYLWMQYEEPT